MYKRLVSITAVIAMVALLFSTAVTETTAQDTTTRATVDESNVKEKMTAFNNDLHDYVTSMTVQQESTFELVGILSQDWTMNVNSYSSLNNSAVLDFMEKFNELYPTYIGAYLNAIELIDSYGDMESEIIPEYTGTRADLNASTRLFFTAAAALISGAMITYSLYKMAKSAFNKNADVSKTIVDDASDSDLQKIRTELDMSATSTKQEIKDHIDSLPMKEKNTVARKVQTLDINAELDTSHGDLIKQTQANIAVDMGRQGVKTYAGAITSVTGGQGIDKLVSAVGGSETVAFAVDVTLTVAEDQPLDLFGGYMDTVTTSSNTKSVQVDKPTTTVSKDAAVQILKNAASGGAVSLDDLVDAGDSLAIDVSDEHNDALEPYDSLDDSIYITVPDEIHVQELDEAPADDTIQIPDMGTSDILISSTKTIPEFFPDENTGSNVELELQQELIDGIDISDVPVDIVFCIDVTGSMFDDMEEVVASAQNTLSEISMKTTNYRIGFLCFRDIEMDAVPFERFGFSSDPLVIQENIQMLPGLVNGGGDWPESVYEGLDLAMGMGFRDDADHMVILMGDAPAKTAYGDTSSGWRSRASSHETIDQSEIDALNEHHPDLDDIINKSKEVKARIYSIVIGSESATADNFREIASSTGGESFFADDASEVPLAISHALDVGIDKAVEDAGGANDSVSGNGSVTCCCTSVMVFIPVGAAMGLLLLSGLLLPAFTRRRRKN